MTSTIHYNTISVVKKSYKEALNEQKLENRLKINYRKNMDDIFKRFKTKNAPKTLNKTKFQQNKSKYKQIAFKISKY